MFLFWSDTPRLEHFLICSVVVYKHQVFIFYRCVCESPFGRFTNTKFFNFYWSVCESPFGRFD